MKFEIYLSIFLSSICPDIVTFLYKSLRFILLSKFTYFDNVFFINNSDCTKDEPKEKRNCVVFFL
jgi:hypothetical protein